MTGARGRKTEAQGDDTKLDDTNGSPALQKTASKKEIRRTQSMVKELEEKMIV